MSHILSRYFSYNISSQQTRNIAKLIGVKNINIYV